MTTIKDLKFDDKNFNKHTQYGMSLIEKSLRENGAGRSILLDKDNNIIAGNGVVESAGQIGLEKVKIIETDGTEIIAVKRTDVRLNSKKGREMALADNATANIDLEWDEENLKSEFDNEELKDWGVIINDLEMPDNLDEENKEKDYKISLLFNNIEEENKFLEDFREIFKQYGCTYSVSGGGL